MSFTICNGMFIVDRVLEVTGDAVHLMIDGVRKWGYLPSLDPEDRERIMREVSTHIITNSAAGPAPEVKTEAGGVQIKQENKMAKLEKFVDLQGNPREVDFEPQPAVKRRTVRPRDPEAEAYITITQAEMKRNERIDHAKAAYDARVEAAEVGFKFLMQHTLSSLDEVTRVRVAQWVELRYGKA